MLLRRNRRETGFEQGCHGHIAAAVGTAKKGFQG
jgi:hypothetical protein